eukprot:3863675-Rhodomonas_salina.1
MTCTGGVSARMQRRSAVLVLSTRRDRLIRVTCSPDPRDVTAVSAWRAQVQSERVASAASAIAAFVLVAQLGQRAVCASAPPPKKKYQKEKKSDAKWMRAGDGAWDLALDGGGAACVAVGAG